MANQERSPDINRPGRDTITRDFTIERVAMGRRLAGFFGTVNRLIEGYEGVVIPNRSIPRGKGVGAGVPIIRPDEIRKNYEILSGVSRQTLRQALGSPGSPLTETLHAYADFVNVVPDPHQAEGTYVVEALFDEKTDARLWEERDEASEELAELAEIYPGWLKWSDRESGFVIATVTADVHFQDDYIPTDNIDRRAFNTRSSLKFATDLSHQLGSIMGFGLTIYPAFPAIARQ